jgi:NADPH:quinone reductase
VELDHSHDLIEQVKSQNIQNIRYVLNLTHSSFYRDQIVEIIDPLGKLVLIDDPESFDITPFKAKSISVGWELMFTRSLFKTSDMIEQHHFLNRVAELCDSGKIRSTLTTENCYFGLMWWRAFTEFNQTKRMNY